jgi:hypothetical protein
MGDIGEMADLMDMEIILTITGREIVDANGTISDDGRSVSWTNQSGPYRATVETGGGGFLGDIPTWGWIVAVLCCLGLAFLVVVIVVVVVLVMRNRKKKEAAPPPAAE